ncbi:hypothetical protein LXL04_018576 [Taraxacum kok-saghyz]
MWFKVSLICNQPLFPLLSLKKSDHIEASSPFVAGETSDSPAAAATAPSDADETADRPRDAPIVISGIYRQHVFIAAWPPSFLSLPSTKSSIFVSSLNRVFPAEACETVGGVACDVDMFPDLHCQLSRTEDYTIGCFFWSADVRKTNSLFAADCRRLGHLFFCRALQMWSADCRRFDSKKINRTLVSLHH